jgi:prophage tail gpP-like protein
MALSRLIEGGVSDRTANGRDGTQEFLDCAAHDETVIRSVEMTWLWE